jgi:hypothetical protein
MEEDFGQEQHEMQKDGHWIYGDWLFIQPGDNPDDNLTTSCFKAGE